MCAIRASIRPRHIGRGNQRSVCRVRTAVQSFNSATAHRPWKPVSRVLRLTDCRPRFNSATAHRPWKLLGRHVQTERPQSFNSATAHRPWKPPTVIISPPQSVRFNSATAHRPWKQLLGAEDGCPLYSASIRPRHIGRGNRDERRLPVDLGLASIRPRHIGRGNRCRNAGHPATVSASIRPRHIGRGNIGKFAETGKRWSRFNSATAHRPWKHGHSVPATRPAGASIRPRHIGRGNKCCCCTCELYDDASIRPRHIGRGNTLPAAGRRESILASIRPRHIGRGNDNAAEVVRILLSQLQFGHGTSAVETGERDGGS